MAADDLEVAETTLAILIQQNYLFLPQYCSRTQVDTFLEELSPQPKKRVVCGTDHNSWSQHFVPGESEAFRFLINPQWISLFSRACDAKPLLALKAWCNFYAPGEFINPHRDVIGDWQVLVCLKTPPQASGGQLHLITGDNITREMIMQPGDVLLFKATQLTHFTSPVLGNTSSNLANQRITLVGRYFYNTLEINDEC